MTSVICSLGSPMSGAFFELLVSVLAALVKRGANHAKEICLIAGLQDNSCDRSDEPPAVDPGTGIKALGEPET